MEPFKQWKINIIFAPGYNLLERRRFNQALAQYLRGAGGKDKAKAKAGGKAKAKAKRKRKRKAGGKAMDNATSAVFFDGSSSSDDEDDEYYKQQRVHLHAFFDKYQDIRTKWGYMSATGGGHSLFEEKTHDHLNTIWQGITDYLMRCLAHRACFDTDLKNILPRILDTKLTQTHYETYKKVIVPYFVANQALLVNAHDHILGCGTNPNVRGLIIQLRWCIYLSKAGELPEDVSDFQNRLKEIFFRVLRKPPVPTTKISKWFTHYVNKNTFS